MWFPSLIFNYDNWNKFISTLDANKFKTDQNWADITSDSDNDEDEVKDEK